MHQLRRTDGGDTRDPVILTPQMVAAGVMVLRETDLEKLKNYDGLVRLIIAAVYAPIEVGLRCEIANDDEAKAYRLALKQWSKKKDTERRRQRYQADPELRERRHRYYLSYKARLKRRRELSQ